MAASCLLRSKGTGVITVPQFIDALQRTWTESRRFRPATGSTPLLPRRVGLAISGGADSMALAYLCRQWEIRRQREQQGMEKGHAAFNGTKSANVESSVTAFVVDHKARQESTQEANTVAGWLRELGITTQILPLNWTGISISAFETQARRLRFQALGKACADRGIETLLMGHHQDDNVETTIWRLSSGAMGAGLAGISPVARIPECHGLFGVAGSGGSVGVGGAEGEALWFGERREAQVSTGGVLISRPLLSFPKSRLVATCHENGVPFVSDPTNFDPTLTPRNAIRSLLASDSLPKALQNDSILSLIGKCQDLIHDSHRVSNDILRSQTRLLDLSLASGSLTVQFSHSSSSIDQGAQEIPSHRLRELQSLTLRRITDLISPFPDNHFPLSSFVDFTDRVFQSDSLTTQESANKDRKAFTLGGVILHPLPPSFEQEEPKWLLTRQPYMRRRDPIHRFTLSLPQEDPSTKQELQAELQAQSLFQLQSEIPWTLWDNRFWIRVSLVPSLETSGCPTGGQGNEKEGIEVLIRPLRQSDLTPLRRLQGKSKKKPKPKTAEANEHAEGEKAFDVSAFFNKLDREAPGQSRFTVPVIAIEENGVDVPLALPTLDLAFPGLESRPWRLTWEWKYKMIDLETLKVMRSV